MEHVYATDQPYDIRPLSSLWVFFQQLWYSRFTRFSWTWHSTILNSHSRVSIECFPHIRRVPLTRDTTALDRLAAHGLHRRVEQAEVPDDYIFSESRR